MSDTIEIIPDYERMREHLLSIWSDPRQVNFREHIRGEPDTMKWLNPPPVKEPPTTVVRVVTIELSVDYDTDVEGLVDLITQRVSGIRDIRETDDEDMPVLRRVLNKPHYRSGDVFDSPLPLDPEKPHGFLNDPGPSANCFLCSRPRLTEVHGNGPLT